MLDPEYVKMCIMTASVGKRNRTLVQKIINNPQPTIDKILTKLKDKTWEPPLHEKVSLREGSHKKERIIEKPIFDDEQIVHHMLVHQIRPILEKRFYELSCGSVPGRGPLTVVHKIRHWRDSYYGKVFYVAELDIKKFYQNVDTEILKRQLSSFIKDDNYLEIMSKVIDCTSPGLPLGFYTSPWLGNLYLTPLDMYILHTLHPDHYIRYMDNLFLFHENKERLHEIVSNIQNFCTEELHLAIKEDWQVFQFENNGTGRAINCLGYIIHEDRITLRKPLLKRIRGKALRMHAKGKITVQDASAMISYSGWLKNSDTYQYYLDYIKPNISFGYCKQLVSKVSKTELIKNDRLENNSQQRIDSSS